MQGFIIKLTKVREEDLLVTILSEENLQTLYRFYGARHSPINIGFKIDYEIETSVKSSIGRLKDVIHLGYPWMGDFKKMLIWQQFITLFYDHLKDVDTLDPFYFHLIHQASQNWNTQNPKRVVVESYIKLLEFEGRLHKDAYCFFCDKPIANANVSLIRAFLPAHKECSFSIGFKHESLQWLYEKHSSLFLEDKEIEYLWLLIKEGF